MNKDYSLLCFHEFKSFKKVQKEFMKKFRVRNYPSYNTIRRIYDNLISKFSVNDLRTQPKIGYKFVSTTENIKKVKNLFENESNTSLRTLFKNIERAKH